MAFDLTKPAMTDADWPTFTANIRENIRAIVQGDTGVFTNGLPPERGRTVRPGEFTTVSTPTMAADAGTVTVDAGDVTRFAYSITGKTMTVQFWLTNISVSAATGNLYIIVPGGTFAASTNDSGTLWYSDNGGAFAQGTIRTYGNGNHIMLYKNLGPSSTANWSISTNNTTIYGCITFSIQ